ncbi:MAG: phosphoglucosamine mutase [Lentisphaeria bacterium]|nr:phosphoglucosamine mutase [Lentisphaeria bacterium]
MGTLFGTDGIRGQANVFPITPEIALKVGKAIGAVYGGSGQRTRRVVIGKDTRRSGYMLEAALTSGLVSTGMSVYLVGPVPTPAVAHLTRSMNAVAGIVLTASHNPYEDNGIKIFDRLGYKLKDSVEAELEALILSDEAMARAVEGRDIGKAQIVQDARGRYIEFAKSTVDNEDLSGLRIVLDCANGAAYLIGPWVFDELGAEVIRNSTDPDGYNINAGCGATHPQNIAELVRMYRADVGIAFDGDADRVVFADAKGAIVDGDRVLAMCAIHSKERGTLARDTLVVTSMSNLGLHESMRERGIAVEVTDVGDRCVIERMREGGYNLGGEKSGHVILHDYATTGDGIITALQVLRLMKQTGRPIASLADCMTEYPHRLESIRVRRKRPIEELETLPDILRRCEAALGDRGRVVARYSGTEMKLRLLVEARDAQAVDSWMAALLEAAGKELVE